MAIDQQGTSWLLMLQVYPPPEDEEIRQLLAGIAHFARLVVPDHQIEMAPLWAASLDIVSLEDLDSLPVST